MARRQGLKPAKRPAAKTVAADERARPFRAFSEAHDAHAGEEITVVCELSPAEAREKIMTSATIIRIAVMQNRMASIPIFLDGCIIVIIDDSKRRSGLGLFIGIDAINEFRYMHPIYHPRHIRNSVGLFFEIGNCTIIDITKVTSICLLTTRVVIFSDR